MAITDLYCTEYCKNISARVREWQAEILLHGAFLGWEAENFEVDYRNLSRMFLNNFDLVCLQNCA